MTYSKSTDFASKDYLLVGNPSKIIRGTEIDDEFAAIESEFANGVVAKTGNTGSAKIPAGTQGQRDVSPATGYTRFNTTIGAFEGYNGSNWVSLGYGGYGVVGFENTTTIIADYSITSGNNMVTAGPISINSGVTVSIPSGSTWSIV